MWESSKLEVSDEIVYCNNDDYYMDDCTKCPKGSICDDGRIIGCFDRYILVNEEKCIPESDLQELEINLSNFSFELASSLNGFNKCYNQGDPHQTINCT